MKWQLTDYDNQQYGSCINEHTFVFKEFDRRNYNLVDELEKLGDAGFYNTYFSYDECWIIEQIDLNDYTVEEITKFCEAYYPHKEIPYLTNWIMAECIFEQISRLY